MDAEKKKKLMIQASEIREKTVELIYHGGGGHIGVWKSFRLQL